VQYCVQQLCTVQCTHMNRPNSCLDWVLSHSANFTVLRFIFVYVLHACVLCRFVTRWGGPGGIEAWFLGPLLPSVLWHCWLSHLTHKNPTPISPIMCLVGREALLYLPISRRSCTARVNEGSHRTCVCVHVIMYSSNLDTFTDSWNSRWWFVTLATTDVVICTNISHGLSSAYNVFCGTLNPTQSIVCL